MDVNQGVNTEEEVKLLQMVKDNLTQIREIPVVVLANKVDEPESKEIQALVDEVCKEVEKVFKVGDRKKSLNKILSHRSRSAVPSATSPAFVPVSAENAYMYRRASGASFDEFKKFNKEFIDKIGREEFGRFKWKKLSTNEQYKRVYEIVNDEEQYKERLAESNFDKFIKVLDYFIGGNDNQITLIQTQMDYMLENLSFESEIADSLSMAYDQCKVLCLGTGHLKDKFWELYEKCEADALKKLLESPSNIGCMHKPMDELMKYDRGLHTKHFMISIEQLNPAKRMKVDKDIIIERMKGLVKKVCNIALEKKLCSRSHRDSSNWRWESHNKRWYNIYSGITNSDASKHPDGDSPDHWKLIESETMWKHKETGYTTTSRPIWSWTDLFPYDIFKIKTSLLMMSCNAFFHKHFSNEIVSIEWKRQTDLLNYQNDYKCKFDDYSVIVVPGSVEDHNHWGHIAWMFCEYANKCENVE